MKDVKKYISKSNGTISKSLKSMIKCNIITKNYCTPYNTYSLNKALDKNLKQFL